MYVFAIAFSACWAVISAKEWELGCPVTVCPFPEEYATNLPHETDCTKFYKCDWGKPVVQDCPFSGLPGYSNQRLHYNRRLQVCDWPWQAGCASCPKEEEDKNDKCTPPNSKISDPDDCNNASYYECISGKPKSRECAKGTRFSRTCQKCVRNPEGGICKEECKNGDRKPHNCDCKFYYECVNNRWEQRSCKGGCHFNPKKKTCQEPDQAGCKFLLEQ